MSYRINAGKLLARHQAKRDEEGPTEKCIGEEIPHADRGLVFDQRVFTSNHLHLFFRIRVASEFFNRFREKSKNHWTHMESIFLLDFL